MYLRTSFKSIFCVIAKHAGSYIHKHVYLQHTHLHAHKNNRQAHAHHITQCIHAHIHVSMHTHMHAHTRTHARTHAHAPTHTHTHTRTHPHTHTHTQSYFSQSVTRLFRNQNHGNERQHFLGTEGSQVRVNTIQYNFIVSA